MPENTCKICSHSISEHENFSYIMKNDSGCQEVSLNKYGEIDICDCRISKQEIIKGGTLTSEEIKYQINFYCT